MSSLGQGPVQFYTDGVQKSQKYRTSATDKVLGLKFHKKLDVIGDKSNLLVFYILNRLVTLREYGKIRDCPAWVRSLLPLKEFKKRRYINFIHCQILVEITWIILWCLVGEAILMKESEQDSTTLLNTDENGNETQIVLSDEVNLASVPTLGKQKEKGRNFCWFRKGFPSRQRFWRG